MNSLMPDDGEDFLRLLAAGGPVRTKLALVVAHQDDEMIAAAGTMARFLDMTLIHVTDGAVMDLAALKSQGFESREACSRTRRAELDAALAAACARPVRRLCYEVPDGEVVRRLDEVTQRLAADLMSVDAVITHPYEGGHVDHDACARAVHEAAGTLRRLTGRAPALLEYASYYHTNGAVRAGLFWPDKDCPETALELSESAIRRREAAFACFASQEGIMRYFSLTHERFRRAPSYDFSKPPPTMSGK
jgi:LmbE family N-acetylglucosaminyl deacetylase